MGKKLIVLIIVAIVLLGSCMQPVIPGQTATESSISRSIASNTAELSSLLGSASPGDVIELESGVYNIPRSSIQLSDGQGGTVTRSWYFHADVDGTETNPITLKSKNPSNPAILEGDGWNENGYVLYITGDYWNVENIIVQGGAKGLILDNSNGTQVQGVEIRDIGQEGLHVRDGSLNTVIDGIDLHDVGKKNDGFGEGVYVGSDNSVWKEGDGSNTGENGYLYSREVHNTIIRNSTIGPNITAEPFDIKEGTTGTIIENNIIYGSGVSGQNYADSHIDLKGTWAVVRYNTIYQSGNSNIKRAIMIVPRQNSGVDDQFTAHHNYIHDNDFTLNSDVDVAVANSGSEENYAWNNTRIPDAGDWYNSRIIEAQPPNYEPGDNPDTEPEPDPDPDTERHNLPGTIQAEDFSHMSGIQTQPTSDVGGGENVGWITSGDWIDFEVDVASSGSYEVTYRVASLSNNIRFSLKSGSTILDTVNSATTGGWQTWKTVTKTVTLSAGEHTLRIAATGSGWNINWIAFNEAEDSSGGEDGGSDGDITVLTSADKEVDFTVNGTREFQIPSESNGVLQVYKPWQSDVQVSINGGSFQPTPEDWGGKFNVPANSTLSVKVQTQSSMDIAFKWW